MDPYQYRRRRGPRAVWCIKRRRAPCAHAPCALPVRVSECITPRASAARARPIGAAHRPNSVSITARRWRTPRAATYSRPPSPTPPLLPPPAAHLSTACRSPSSRRGPAIQVHRGCKSLHIPSHPFQAVKHVYCMLVQHSNCTQ